eukprot:c18283_g1_i1 orf=241-483(-)
MSSTGTKKGVLEVFKFACYVCIPISMMALFANNPDNLEKVVRNRSYVVYPPEGPPLPPPEEIREMIRKGRAASDSTKSGV